MESSVTNATITVRIIRSLEYKNHRNLVLHNVDLTKMTRDELLKIVQEKLENQPSLKPVANQVYDTLKLYSQPHGAKCNNPIINLGADELLIISQDNVPLHQLGVGNETELSLFNKADYEAYRLNPVSKW